MQKYKAHYPEPSGLLLRMSIWKCEQGESIPRSKTSSFVLALGLFLLPLCLWASRAAGNFSHRGALPSSLAFPLCRHYVSIPPAALLF